MAGLLKRQCGVVLCPDCTLISVRIEHLLRHPKGVTSILNLLMILQWNTGMSFIKVFHVPTLLLPIFRQWPVCWMKLLLIIMWLKVNSSVHMDISGWSKNLVVFLIFQNLTHLQKVCTKNVFLLKRFIRKLKPTCWILSTGMHYPIKRFMKMAVMSLGQWRRLCWHKFIYNGLVHR